MKKLFAFLTLLAVTAFAVFAAQPDTIPTNIITGGDSILEILKSNWAVLAIIAYSCLEFWLGQTGKIKEGSFLALVLNFIGKFIRKQLPVVKGKFMSEEQFKAVRGLKTIVIIIGLSFFSLAASAQGSWDGFFKPKSGTPYTLKADGDKSVQWFFRPAANMTALQFTYNKDLETFEASTFSSAGIGLGYQHYVEHNGIIINNFGLNLLLVLDASQGSAGTGAAFTVNALQFVNIGLGYSISNKTLFIPIGAVWNF
jgi:hypothetical protein